MEAYWGNPIDGFKFFDFVEDENDLLNKIKCSFSKRGLSNNYFREINIHSNIIAIDYGSWWNFYYLVNKKSDLQKLKGK